MVFFSAILALALSRSDLIDRMKAHDEVRFHGSVNVVASCPQEMRKTYHKPVANFAAGVYQRLAVYHNHRLSHANSPYVTVYIGDGTTNDTRVVAINKTLKSGARETIMYLCAPQYSDMDKFLAEVVKSFYWAIDGEKIDDETALRRFRAVDPLMRAEDEMMSIRAWKNGIYEKGADDEEYLERVRSVSLPGKAFPDEVLLFASRLRLYPLRHDEPFLGVHDSCNFKEAITLAKKDVRIRFIAHKKMVEILAYGGGRGESLSEAASLYAKFLNELTRGNMADAELLSMLELADRALEKAFAKSQFTITLKGGRDE
jgi:hypothetical protein